MIFFFRFVFVFIWLSSLAWAEGDEGLDNTHSYIKSGVLYSNVQTFQQDAYILKVIGSGSPMTVIWQFKVSQERDYWLNKEVVSVRLGRQVIPDLVTQRWLMRELSGGVVKQTNDAHEAMRFLTNIQDVAVLDLSILEKDATYILGTRFFMYEGEEEQESWIPLFGNSGIDMGVAPLPLEILANEK